jgi:hypothetical protein
MNNEATADGLKSEDARITIPNHYTRPLDLASICINRTGTVNEH